MSRDLARERMAAAMDVELGGDRLREGAKLAEQKRLTLDSLDTATLPPAYTPAREIALAEPVTEIENPRDQLHSVVTKAIAFLEDVLDMEADLSTEAVRVLSIKLQAAQTAINTQVKVNDSDLRRREVDMLPRLLELIAREEGKMLELEAQ